MRSPSTLRFVGSNPTNFIFYASRCRQPFVMSHSVDLSNGQGLSNGPHRSSFTKTNALGRRLLIRPLWLRLDVHHKDHNRNFKTSKALLKGLALQGTSLFASAATNQREIFQRVFKRSLGPISRGPGVTFTKATNKQNTLESYKILGETNT